MKILIVVFCLSLTGCALNTLPRLSSVDKPYMDNVQSISIGVPILLGLSGSEVVVNNQYTLSARHNGIVLPDSAIKHPDCDIAIYPTEGFYSGLELGTLNIGAKVFFTGKVAPILPKQHLEGVYIGDAIGVFGKEDKCLYSFSTSGNIAGMSGGGVFNEGGELVGIVVGILYGWFELDGEVYYNPSIFLRTEYVINWIKENINE